MIRVEHQFLNMPFYTPDWEISHLFLGTFNPEGGDKVNYFYGRSKNKTWKLISEVFKDDFNPEEFEFFLAKLKKNKIACMDMIKSANVPEERITSINGNGYSDSKLINNSIQRDYNTQNILNIISQNKNIKVYSTWGAGPQIANWTDEIKKLKKIIPLVSPSMAARVPLGTEKFKYMLDDWSQKIAPTNL
ncbi:uracil-DNA glycosylase family protein [Zobellia barbeyronii]|uniref:G/U mismatch-specific uracil-DNA glycosylase n=1 Tax=Zobellia barbeyronii TaxID=2748009 RepID=A0ABS5WBF9_9FLAO|nr:hypothetical protein [Zobellia barbeyronii]MBT2160258.1 hypothetical protein [Zobellia barbeyronii]